MANISEINTEEIESSERIPENTILVVGGCGFVGFHIVSALRKTRTWSSIHVMSRNPSRNRHEGVNYHSGDITSPDQVKQILFRIRPGVIIHAASPVANDGDAQTFSHVNLAGTQNLLRYAAESEIVKAFVYTSSSSVMLGTVFNRITESAPTIVKSTRGANPYSKSKALADRMVLDFNGAGNLRTATLRICGVYGERDNQQIPNALKVMRQGRHKTQIGSNRNRMDVTSAENVATAHVLAVQALLQPSSNTARKVDGEAFLITEDSPVHFWSWMRQIWAAAGSEVPLDEITVLPAWLVLSLASIVEYLYYIFTLGQKRPSLFRREFLEYTCCERTFCIDKAKTRLGYHPTSKKRDEQIKKSVEWAQQEYIEATRNKN